MRLETIRLSRINLRDERFRISHFFDVEPMAQSIREIGLRNPPLVLDRDNRFILVSGWKRVLACRDIGLSEIPALVNDQGDDLKVFVAAVQENLLHRALSLTEKAVILDKLLAFGMGKKAVVGETMPSLLLPATTSHLRRLLDLVRARGDVKKYAHEKDIPIGVLESLLRFGDADRSRILPVLRPLGQNKQKEVLDDLWEISRRDRVSVRRVLGGRQIGETLRSAKLSPLQKADRVRRILRSLRYPALSSRQASFDMILRKMGRPREIVIQPSPYFDDDRVGVSFRFRSADEFRERLTELERLAARPEFLRLFRE
jgi:ParB-like chromosome segregation protein Spo0J